MLENKNTTEMKNAFYGLLNKLEHSLRISELKYMSIETSKLKGKKKKIYKNCGTILKDATYTQ